MENHDLVELIINNWQREIPGIKTDGTEVIARIVRLANFINQQVDDNLYKYNITLGEFDVLAALRRQTTSQLTPGKLQNLVMVTSGGLTSRINRLEAKKLIVRRSHPKDRRGTIIELTEEGKALIDKVAPTHLNLEYDFIKKLTDNEQKTLATLLKKLLVEHENLDFLNK